MLASILIACSCHLAVPQLPDYWARVGEMVGFVHRVSECLEVLRGLLHYQRQPVFDAAPPVNDLLIVNNTAVQLDAGKALCCCMLPLLLHAWPPARTLHLDFRLPSTCRVAIVGPSGSGKTSFLRVLAGMRQPSQGTIAWHPDAQPVFVPHAIPMFYGSLKDVLLFPTLPDSSRAAAAALAPLEASDEAEAQLRDALSRVGLSSLVHELDRVDDWKLVLSEGEKQRVAFARLLLQR